MVNATLDMLLLFASSLLAATIFPAQSEAMLAALYTTGAYPASLLVTIATVGNVIGSCINWLLGRYATQFSSRKWFPVREITMQRATRTYRRFGVWTLLFAWVPVIGDPLTLVAGFMRTPLPLFLLLVTLGKAARYIAFVAIL